jgi:hypothetical protein
LPTRPSTRKIYPDDAYHTIFSYQQDIPFRNVAMDNPSSMYHLESLANNFGKPNTCFVEVYSFTILKVFHEYAIQHLIPVVQRVIIGLITVPFPSWPFLLEIYNGDATLNSSMPQVHVRLDLSYVCVEILGRKELDTGESGRLVGTRR